MLKTSVTRRSFLRFVGAGVGGALASPLLAHIGSMSTVAGGTSDDGGWFKIDGSPAWETVPYPVPLPSDAMPAGEDAIRFAKFVVGDELKLPEGFEYEVLAKWGDVFGPSASPEKQIRFGYNADYTGLIPVKSSKDEFWLLTNHEYISGRPWIQGIEQLHGESFIRDGRIAGLMIAGASLNITDQYNLQMMNPLLLQGVRRLCDLAMRDLGVSILRVRRNLSGGLEVISESPDHLRISAASGRWDRSVQMSFTGDAADLLGIPEGTFSNCSGATTPWGTFLSCEENFQEQVQEFVAPDGAPLPGARQDFLGTGEGHPTKLPLDIGGLGTGLQPALDGRQYGWVIEVDPVHRTMKKHTALGRFRHENVALRVESQRKLAAYMGDDRRGGHVWKFISDGVVDDECHERNSTLLEMGTLHVARFNDDFTGEWLPLTADARLMRPSPEYCSLNKIWLPNRPAGGHVEVGETEVDEWIESIESFASKAFVDTTLGDLCIRPETILLDAFAMANAIGGTPCARPEDIEIHPIDKSVYVAFTDSTGSGDGSPDVRIFPDSKGENSRQYGAIYRIREHDDDPAATRFTWGKFISSGETADGGGGFACADNLVFDPLGNLWVVSDISTAIHHFPVNRADDHSSPGGRNFPGVFGNNALFCIPTRGIHAGMPFCFAIGPMECELTGPTFMEDGETLVLSIQHPGEFNGTRGMPGVDQPLEVQRQLSIAGRDGTVFNQDRAVPIGSNFPSSHIGVVPRPCVVVIRRK